MREIAPGFLFCISGKLGSFNEMKNFFLLLIALLIIVVFGGSAFFFWDTSKGARFERLDQPASETTEP